MLYKSDIACRIANNIRLWYYLFKSIYPSWSYNLSFSYMKQPLINWRSFMIKQQKISSSINLETFYYFHTKNYYQIQEPFVYDIDPNTNTGVIGLSMHTTVDKRHRIAFFNYPSYELIREYNVSNFTPSNWSCQIMGIQSINFQQEKVRLFAVVICKPPVDQEDDDRMNTWQSLLIYRLYDNGYIQCLADINNLDSYQFLGRGIFFFSNEDQPLQVKDWLNIIDNHRHSHSSNFVYMLAFGLDSDDYNGHGHIIQFDLYQSIMDPLLKETYWIERPISTAKIIFTAPLGIQVSCMIHFRHYPQLHHLVCIGNFESEELSIYDWRFGIKVGSIGWDKNIQPWGFESTFAVLPSLSSSMSSQQLSAYGLRLVAVGDAQEDNSFEIILLDITHLLQVDWNPFKDTSELKRIILNNHTSMPYNNSNNNDTSVLRVHRLNRKVEYTAYNILHTSLYLLTREGQLCIMDIESGNITKTVNVGSSVDINVLGSRDVIVTRKHGLLLLKHE